MAGNDLVRPSRDGDQFHYNWAARQCLKLLSNEDSLVAISIEGASSDEGLEGIEEGEQLIDVGFYYGAESLNEANLIRYVQLKHSSRHEKTSWTASGLKKTLKGFAQRYLELLKHYPEENIHQRFRFEYTTNRPIDIKVQESLEDLSSTNPSRHPDVYHSLLKYTELEEKQGLLFFKLFKAEGDEEGLWQQRNLLTQDLNAYLTDADYDSPVQLKELVTRKATTEFESAPSIRRHDVLRVLKTSEEQLQPSPCQIPQPTETLPRQQEKDILKELLSSDYPIILHADGGEGKSVLASRLASSVPAGFKAILYDCYGDGLYRNSLNFRHRHRDALVQIANELSAHGLCHPLIPTMNADAKQYMRAFLHRLKQAVGILRAGSPNGGICLIIDAADNAEMAAEEQREPSSFVQDLIRTPLPSGVHIVFTCRTHRRSRLKAPPKTKVIKLLSFTENETGQHLRKHYPEANADDVAEFHFLSSSNPRVQALAISRDLPLQNMLKLLGPEPTTVDQAIEDLLEAEIADLRDREGSIELPQIDLICQGLAVLRPLVPINVLSQISQTSESAVRSFALGLSRPLQIKGNSIHFRDEPSETWFREHFKPSAENIVNFLTLLRPLTSENSYVSAVLPQLLLEAGEIDELVKLALSGEGLPLQNPLEKRDVELQRLTFALKACLQRNRYLDAAKLALKAGTEFAGEQRQNRLIQDNTDLTASLMAPDRIEEIISKRIFSSGWAGSHHAYDAGLLSGCEEYTADALSRHRMSMDWLQTWARLPDEEREQEEVSQADITEITLTLLRLKGADEAAAFVRQWKPRSLALEIGRSLGQRLIDLGQYEQLNELAEAGVRDVWLLLGIFTEVSESGFPHLISAKPLANLLRILGYKRVRLSEPQQWDKQWSVLHAIRSSIELALISLPHRPKEWATLIQRYLPSAPPSDLARQHGGDRAPLLRTYALEAALRGKTISLNDLAPPEVLEELNSKQTHSFNRETHIFKREVGGLLPWIVLSTEIICGRIPSDLALAVDEAAQQGKSLSSGFYRDNKNLQQSIAREWLRIFCIAEIVKAPELERFKKWLSDLETPLWPETLTCLCRMAARKIGLQALAIKFASDAFDILEDSRDDAESSAESYLKLSRAILTVNSIESGIYFKRAVDIASRIGDENLHRWTALLHLAKAAGKETTSRPCSAYKLSRVAELTYEYVARDKHFDWDGTVEALTDLCGSSVLSILSRWRDRRFGNTERLVPIAVYQLISRDELPLNTPIVLGGIKAQWDRTKDLERALAQENDTAQRYVIAQISYRYIRPKKASHNIWLTIKELGERYGIDFLDIDRLVASTIKPEPSDTEQQIPAPRSIGEQPNRRKPDWNIIFEDIDLTDSGALKKAYADLRTYDPPYELETFFQQALSRVTVGSESRLVNAISSWPDFGIYELHYMLSTVQLESIRQISFRNAIKDAVLIACYRDPDRIIRRGWGRLIPFEELFRLGFVSDAEVVQATLKGFTSQLDILGVEDFFQLIDPLASCLSADEADEALNFGMDLLEEVIKPEDGDGPWQPKLNPPQSVISALAGYIWAGLGSPETSERWQCAHAVRAIIELGWSELLDELIACAETDSAAPFVDQNLPFYLWHARQWLLIGLARGLITNHSALIPALPLIKNWAHEEHVLIRELSAQILLTFENSGHISSKEFDYFLSINQPELPERIYSGWAEPVDDDVFEEQESLTDDEKYYFGIDITPYWFAPLGRAFGLNEGAIEKRARLALKQHMGWSGAEIRLADPRYIKSIFDGRETNHSHGSHPKTYDLCAYHSYHAMMFVAATLLKERAVIRHDENKINEFEEWLSPYLLARDDGEWLFDRRDPQLTHPPQAPEGYNDSSWRWNVTSKYIDQQLTSDDDLIVLWGSWTGYTDDSYEIISIRSSLVSRKNAKALIAALQTSSDTDRFFLPEAESERNIHYGEMRMRGWVIDIPLSTRLDEGDPWSEGLHYPGPRPSEEVIEKIGLQPSQDGRFWSVESNKVLRSETWTQKVGYGHEQETLAGSRLCGKQEFLRYLSKKYPEECIVLRVSIRRRPPRHMQKEDEFQSYTWPYVRYYIMEEDGVAYSL